MKFSGFHAQQTAEKALKAWLAALGVEYPRTHAVSLLLRRLRAEGQVVDGWHDLVEFNAYAVQFRYEAFDGLGEPLLRGAVVARLEGLVRLIESVLASR